MFKHDGEELRTTYERNVETLTFRYDLNSIKSQYYDIPIGLSRLTMISL